jgi:hypothetical protein
MPREYSKADRGVTNCNSLPKWTRKNYHGVIRRTVMKKLIFVFASLAALAGCAAPGPGPANYGTRAYAQSNDPNGWQVVSVTPVPLGTGERAGDAGVVTSSEVVTNPAPVVAGRQVYGAPVAPVYGAPVYVPAPVGLVSAGVDRPGLQLWQQLGWWSSPRRLPPALTRGSHRAAAKNAPKQGGRTACAASFILPVHTPFFLPISYAGLSCLHGAMRHSNRLLLADC